ncbi:MAG: hypothetical protein M1833_003293 [Piccolia ochrophora]|nr:MAG: hypothetical protein M1833_003293 [Piccolia ochrophora]
MRDSRLTWAVFLLDMRIATASSVAARPTALQHVLVAPNPTTVPMTFLLKPRLRSEVVLLRSQIHTFRHETEEVVGEVVLRGLLLDDPGVLQFVPGRGRLLRVPGELRIGRLNAAGHHEGKGRIELTHQERLREVIVRGHPSAELTSLSRDLPEPDLPV